MIARRLILPLMELSWMSLAGVMHIVCTHYAYKFFQMTPWRLGCMGILLQSNFNAFNLYYLATTYIFFKSELFCALLSNLWNSMPPTVNLCPEDFLAVPQISCFALWLCVSMCIEDSLTRCRFIPMLAVM